MLIIGGIVFLLAVLLVKEFWKGMKEAEREARRKSTVERELWALLDKHLNTLALKKRQLTATDAYGIEDNSKWINERSHFMNNVVFPQLNE